MQDLACDDDKVKISRLACGLVAAFLLVISSGVGVVSATSEGSDAPSSPGTSGDLEVVRDLATPVPLDPAVRSTMLDAQSVADSNPEVLAGAWLNHDTGVVTVGAVGTAGLRSAEAALEMEGIDGEVAVEVVQNSASALDDVVQNVYSLDGAEEVHGAWHDWARNQAIVTASDPSEELLQTLHREFGEAVVVYESEPFETLQDPDGQGLVGGVEGIGAVADRRDEDGSSLRGGGKWRSDDFAGSVSYCSMGFPWKAVGEVSARYMITAGHCLSKEEAATHVASNDYGGVNKDYNYYLGGLAASNTTWRTGPGTVAGNGDLARISMIEFGRLGSATMWTGGWDSKSYRTLEGVKKWASNGDPACYSAASTGAYCGYTVYATDATYETKNGAIVRQQIRAKKDDGQCAKKGDSGGSVYQRKGSSGAIAFGILSGASGGGEDAFIGEAEGIYADCHISFTALGQAYQQWDGGGEIFTR